MKNPDPLQDMFRQSTTGLILCNRFQSDVWAKIQSREEVLSWWQEIFQSLLSLSMKPWAAGSNRCYASSFATNKTKPTPRIWRKRLAWNRLKKSGCRNWQRLIAMAFAALPTDQRTAALLHEYDDFPRGEIATTLGCSTKAVENKLYRAQQFLRERFAGWMKA